MSAFGFGEGRPSECEWLLSPDGPPIHALVHIFPGGDARIRVIGQKRGAIRSSAVARDFPLNGSGIAEKLSRPLRKHLKERANKSERLQRQLEELAMTLTPCASAGDKAPLDLIFVDAPTAAAVREVIACQLETLAASRSFRVADMAAFAPTHGSEKGDLGGEAFFASSVETPKIESKNDLDELYTGVYVSERYTTLLGGSSLRPRVLQLRTALAGPIDHDACAGRPSIVVSTAADLPDRDGSQGSNSNSSASRNSSATGNSSAMARSSVTGQRPEDFLDLHDAFDTSERNVLERLVGPTPGGHVRRRLKDLKTVERGCGSVDGSMDCGGSGGGISGIGAIFGGAEDDPERALTLVFSRQTPGPLPEMENLRLVCMTPKACESVVSVLQLLLATRESADYTPAYAEGA